MAGSQTARLAERVRVCVTMSGRGTPLHCPPVCPVQPSLLSGSAQRGGVQLCAGQYRRKERAPVLADVVGAVFLHAALLVKRLALAEQALELDLASKILRHYLHFRHT